ncbi:MAG TPA: ribosome small subunit-dependent GTPase A [Candidatus Nanopelagicales bacterium]|nr:ribosome small subunit-dependent GTPase A [Candidatus Nanopelagicales bacterium]
MVVLALPALGWDPSWDGVRADADPSLSLRPARVTLQGRDAWRVHDGDVELVVGVRGRLRAESTLPVAGDWVLLAGTSADDSVVERVLPRRTSLVRHSAGATTTEQVVAANVDVVLVCVPAHSVNPRRLEREITLVWESGARPVVALTKADLDDDTGSTLDELRSIAIGAEVLAVSSYDGDGLDDVRVLADGGSTLAVIGPSGAGKSTLVNALVGHELLATTAVRDDHRGVHTTSARHLVPLPDGGLILDTPGMREVGLWGDEEPLDAAFHDVEAFAVDCRFADCQHRTEPGCAVLAAVEAGLVDDERLASWRKLQRELAYLARKQDVRLAIEERKKWARISKSFRDQGQIRP